MPISLHLSDTRDSALVVLYLLTLCWVTNICLLASCGNIKEDVRILQLLSVIQSIVVLAFALAVLITAPTFGSYPECNTHALLVFMRPFKVFNVGRIIGGVTCGTVSALYTFMTAYDYLSPILAKIKQRKRRNVLPAPGSATEAPPQPDASAHLPQPTAPVEISDANIKLYAELGKRVKVRNVSKMG